MSSEVETFNSFLEDQKAKQAPHFPTVKVDKVLSFMGTTSLPGTFNAVAVNRVLGFEPAAAGRELRITLGGALARSPEKGECVTVHITRVEKSTYYAELQIQRGETLVHIDARPSEIADHPFRRSEKLARHANLARYAG